MRCFFVIRHGQTKANLCSHCVLLFFVCVSLTLTATRPSSLCSRFNDSRCNSKFVSTYGTNTPGGKTRYRKTKQGGRYEFKYNEVVANWYVARPAVDHNNQVRQGWIDLTLHWSPHNWATRQFAYFFAVAEANAMFAMKYFQRKHSGDPLSPVRHRDFRLALAEQLFEFAHQLRAAEHSDGTPPAPLNRSDPKRMRLTSPHQLFFISGSSAEASAHHAHTMYPKFVRGYNCHTKSWIACAKKYLQVKCCKCDVMTRKYCSCAKNVPLCINCFYVHKMGSE